MAEDPVTRIGWVIADHEKSPNPYAIARAVITQLHKEIDIFRAELEAAGKSDHTVDTYCGRSEFFVRWLEGDFKVKDTR